MRIFFYEKFEKTSPATNIVSIVKRLQSLLDNPCSDKVTCYNPSATELFLTNKREYEKFFNDCVDESLKEDNFDDQDELFNWQKRNETKHFYTNHLFT